MTTYGKARTSTTRRVLLGMVAALGLVVAMVTPAAAGSIGGGVRDDVVMRSGGPAGGMEYSAGRGIGEEIPTVRGGLSGGIEGISGSIVIPQ
ncbi:MAG: hypothetical protein AB7R89_25870 [Dehalococcoidia bacterium]